MCIHIYIHKKRSQACCVMTCLKLINISWTISQWDHIIHYLSWLCETTVPPINCPVSVSVSFIFSLVFHYWSFSEYPCTCMFLHFSDNFLNLNSRTGIDRPNDYMFLRLLICIAKLCIEKFTCPYLFFRMPISSLVIVFQSLPIDK